jgi:hypothetical protein
MEYLIMNARRTTGVYGTYHVTGIQVDIDRVDKPGIENKVQAALWVELVT